MRMVIGATFVAMAAFLAAHYGRELWINATRPDQFEDVVKLKIRHGEDGGRDVSRKDKLFFSYPLFILAFGVGGWLLATSS